MQRDGNLTLVDDHWDVIWQTNTGGHPGAELHLQDDGNMFLWWNNQNIWSAGTWDGIDGTGVNSDPWCDQPSHEKHCYEVAAAIDRRAHVDHRRVPWIGCAELVDVRHARRNRSAGRAGQKVARVLVERGAFAAKVATDVLAADGDLLLGQTDRAADLLAQRERRRRCPQGSRVPIRAPSSVGGAGLQAPRSRAPRA